MVRAGGLSAFFLVAMFSSGCHSSPGTDGVTGSYSVTISQGGLSDPDVVSIFPGAHDTLLLEFATGVTTDLMGPNPNGLIASWDGMQLTLDRQPAHIEHSTGQLDGVVSGTGTLTADGSALMLTLSFEPNNLIASDAGTRTDGGVAILSYTVSGAKM
jgi:hypothetical protein